MKLKTWHKSVIFFAVILILTGVLVLKAQEVQCSETIRDWQGDRSMAEYMATHNCTCPYPNRTPVCTEKGGRRPTPAPVPANPGEGGANTNNSAAEAAARAEAERKLRDEEFKSRNEKLKAGLKTGKPPISTNLGLKPSSGGVIREQTIERIKELNCSAFWGVRATEAALGTRNEVTANLEDEFTKVRQYAEFSAQAKGGKSVEGCPEVKISVPDVPPPLQSNPQLQFYDRVIAETQKLLPEITDTVVRQIEQVSWLEETKDTKKTNEAELKSITNKPNTAANRAKKRALVSQSIEIDKLLSELQTSVDKLVNASDELEKKVAELKTRFNIVSNDPVQAQKFLNK